MEIYVWGTGCGASEAIERGLDISGISAFVDSNPLNKTFMGLPVIKPEKLKTVNPELIIVTCRYADQVAENCRALGIDDSRILFLKDYNIMEDRNRNCTKAAEILGQEIISRLLPPQHIVTAPSSLQNPKLQSSNDYVRISTLELLTRRIADVPGEMAELGVYKGGFASCMNRLMPDRKLYLFDTFSGFDRDEGKEEKSRNTCGESFLEAHQNTTAELVMKNMPNPENVIIKEGYFPQSLHGLEESFALVSLDADFRDSTLHGLRYFWPRLNIGGYLMLHDWGCPRLTGVAEALELYEKELGYRLPAVPIPDIGNSIILQKVKLG